MTAPRILIAPLSAILLSGCVLPGPALTLAGQQAELERRLAGSAVSISRAGETLILRMPTDVTFEVDKAKIAPAFHATLDQMADTIANAPATRVQITGHADATGKPLHNQQLSERRAAAVGDYLASKGVEHHRLLIQGMGEKQPIAPNTTEHGRALNRRVEVILQPTSF